MYWDSSESWSDKSGQERPGTGTVAVVVVEEDEVVVGKEVSY